MLMGKTILVTGVASGIGARTAELASVMGADVIGVDRHAPTRPIGAFVQADIASPSSIAEMATRLPSRIDAICNVAGVSGNGGIVQTLSINFYGLREVTEAVAPRLREGAAVVNVASIAAFGWRANIVRAKAMIDVNGFPEVAALASSFGATDEIGYPLSKELLLLWTMRAAHEARFKTRGIRVNAVSPGPVQTPILTQFREVLGDERVDRDIERVGRSGTPADVAPVILFLCSDAARWINGANVAVDGGLEAAVTAETMGF